MEDVQLLRERGAYSRIHPLQEKDSVKGVRGSHSMYLARLILSNVSTIVGTDGCTYSECAEQRELRCIGGLGQDAEVVILGKKHTCQHSLVMTMYRILTHWKVLKYSWKEVN